jgi:transposase
MVSIVEDLVGDWSHLDERIENVKDEIEALARDDASCRQLMTVPGVGPITGAAGEPPGIHRCCAPTGNRREQITYC